MKLIVAVKHFIQLFNSSTENQKQQFKKEQGRKLYMGVRQTETREEIGQ